MMGLLMHFLMGAMPLVGALYGQPTVAAGWLAHLAHSVVLAFVFAAAIDRTSFRDSGLLGLVGLGAAYGVLLGVVTGGVVLPLWANAVGAAQLPVPSLGLPGMIAHVLYGVVLGGVVGFWSLRGRPADVGADQHDNDTEPAARPRDDSGV
jgi:hypothetical protein